MKKKLLFRLSFVLRFAALAIERCTGLIQVRMGEILICEVSRFENYTFLRYT